MKCCDIGVVQFHPGHFRCKLLVWQLLDTKVKVCLATSSADLSQESMSARPYKTRRKRGDHSDLSAG